MADYDWIFQTLGYLVIAAPSLLFGTLGTASLVERRLSEQVIGRLARFTIATGLLAVTALLDLMLIFNTKHVVVPIANWEFIPGYHFVIKFVFDRLSVPFVILAFVLCGTVAQFAIRYMHRERGFSRFFVLYSLFVLGMVVTSLAGTIETLFAGWELVGLSSALLVAFFHDRTSPVRNGARVWTVYRVSDAALLTASVVLHHMAGAGDFDQLLGNITSWPEGHAALEPNQALIVGLLLLLAAMGKSALVPFSGWLPRAMEGPTPSSAVFYGALSVHLGAFLLLRISPLIDLSPWLAAAIVVVGLSTALFATLAERVQSDIKCALTFASMAQVGLIVAEIGFGLRYLALVHILGHACLRTLQFVRAPTILHDYHTLENAIGGRLHKRHLPSLIERLLGTAARIRLYRFAIERGYLDTVLARYFVAPFLKVFQWCDRMERRWIDFLAGQASHEPSPANPAAANLEDYSLT